MEVAGRLVGRAEELGRVEHVLSELAAGRPGLLELAGEPGIGKTRLLAELGTNIEREGYVVIESGPHESGAPVPYGAIRRAVEYSAAHDFADSLQFEGSMMTLTGATEDHRNAVTAFVTKQKPVFEGR